MKSLPFEDNNQYPCHLDRCFPDGLISVRDSISMIALEKRILFPSEKNTDFSFSTVHQSIAMVLIVWMRTLLTVLFVEEKQKKKKKKKNGENVRLSNR